MAEIRVRWNRLKVRDKLKYIQQAFKSQTDVDIPSNEVKLTKEEQLLMEYSKGKPLSIATFGLQIRQCRRLVRAKTAKDGASNMGITVQSIVRGDSIHERFGGSG